MGVIQILQSTLARGRFLGLAVSKLRWYSRDGMWRTSSASGSWLSWMSCLGPRGVAHEIVPMTREHELVE